MVDFAHKLRLRQHPYGLGLARMKTSMRRTGAAYVLVERPIAFDALPKSVAPGAHVTLSGRFTLKVAEPRIHWDLAGRATRSAKLVPDPEGRFSVAVEAPTTPGRVDDRPALEPVSLLRYAADHTDVPVLEVEPLKAVDDQIEQLRIERAKPLIEEEELQRVVAP